MSNHAYARCSTTLRENFKFLTRQEFFSYGRGKKLLATLLIYGNRCNFFLSALFIKCKSNMRYLKIIYSIQDRRVKIDISYSAYIE